MLFGCADAAKGYTAAPQAKLMNSRRLIEHCSQGYDQALSQSY